MGIFVKNRFLSLFIAVLSTLFFIRCHNAATSTGSTDLPKLKISPIHVFSKLVKYLKLPLNDTCDGSLPIQHLNLPDSLSQYTKYGELIGKVSETSKYTAMLYVIPADVQLPVLHVFDTNGNEISSLKLFIGNCCGENEACSGLSTVQITKDLHIILKDSTETFERSKRNSNKKRNVKVIKNRQEFIIDNTGKLFRVTSIFNYRYLLVSSV